MGNDEAKLRQLLDLGISKMKECRDAESIAIFQEAIKIQPFQSLAYFNIGQLFLKQGHYSKACEEFATVTHSDPSHSSALIQWAFALYHMGQYEKSSEKLSKALQIEPNSIKANILCGWIALKEQRYSHAAQFYSKVLALEPQNNNALTLRDKCLPYLCEKEKGNKVNHERNNRKHAVDNDISELENSPSKVQIVDYPPVTRSVVIQTIDAPQARLEELAKSFLNFNDFSFHNKLFVGLTKEEIGDIFENIQRGYSLDIAICGSAKSGKSTFLNFILSGKGNAGIFLDALDAETSICWLFQEDKKLESDTCLVRHIDFEGNLGENSKIFWDSQDLKAYLRANYGRDIIKEKKKKNNTKNPYNQIQIRYGVPTKKLYKPLFESAVNIIDTQAFGESGVRSGIFNSQENAFILICCISCTKGSSHQEYNLLVKIIAEKKPLHLIFIFTNVDAALERMQSEAIDPQSKDNSKKIEYDKWLPKLKEDMNKELKQNIKLPYDHFFFDPDSLNEVLQSGAENARLRLVTLRKELKLEGIFFRKMSKSLIEKIAILRNTHKILCIADIDKELTAQYENDKQDLKNLFKRLRLDFHKDLMGELEKSLEETVLNQAKERKGIFMSGDPSTKQLRERIYDWFMNEGFQDAILKIVQEVCQKFLDTHRSVIVECFGKEFNRFQPPLEFSACNSFNLKAFRPENPRGTIISEAFLSSLQFLFQCKWNIYDSLGAFFLRILFEVFCSSRPASFEYVCKEEIAKIKEKIFAQRDKIEEICEHMSANATTIFEKAILDALTRYYAENYSNKPDGYICDHSIKQFSIDLRKLDEIRSSLIEFNQQYGESLPPQCS